MHLLHAAAETFPLDEHVRALPAYALVQFGHIMPPRQTIQEIDRVLVNDPFSLDLRLDELMEMQRLGER